METERSDARGLAFTRIAALSLILAAIFDVLPLVGNARFDVRWSAPLAGAWLNVFIVAFSAHDAGGRARRADGGVAVAWPDGGLVWRADWWRRCATAARAAARSARWQPWVVPACVAASLPIATTPWSPLAQPVVGNGATPPIVAGLASLALAFGALVAERFCSMQAPRARAYEGVANVLRVAVLVAVLAAVSAGAYVIAGVTAEWLVRAAALFNAAVAVEFALRTALSWFAPPRSREREARALDSLLAGLLRFHPSPLARIGAELRHRYGIDFRQNQVLASLVRLAPAALVSIAVAAWLLTGVVMLGPDQRAVYERFGEPAAVWQPGLHVGLPWPFGTARRVDNGAVRQLIVSGSAQDDSAATPPISADARAPEQADRLWDVTHRWETSQVIAGASGERQNFQIVSADVRLDYRIGLTDAAARAALYRADDLPATVRAIANREVVRYLASHTLASLLETRQTAMADDVRRAVQAQLDRLASGVEVVAVVIESVHPPAGAADAYHGVQAAQIRAEASVADARGFAAAALGNARQQAQTAVASAEAQAAEAVSAARTQQATFNAQIAAAQAGGPAFGFEYYLHNLRLGLQHAHLTIIDDRLAQGGRATIDLRPYGARDAVGLGRTD